MKDYIIKKTKSGDKVYVANPQPWGGKRARAGRTAKHGKTIVMRVPIALRETILQLIADFRK